MSEKQTSDQQLRIGNSVAVQNSFSHPIDSVTVTKTSSTTESVFATYVKNLIRDYINARNKGDTSDKHQINQQLLIEFKDRFSSLVQKYANDLSENFKIDEIINGIFLQNDVKESIQNEIKALIVSSLKKLIVDKINVRTVNRIPIQEIRDQINKIQFQKVGKTESSKVIDDILSSSNTDIINAKKEFGDAIQTYRDTLFKMFDDQISYERDRAKYFDQIDRSKPENKFKGYIDNQSIRYASKLCDSLYKLIIFGSAYSLAVKITDSIKFISKIPAKIIKGVGKFLASSVKGIIGGAFSFFTNVILTPIRFVISKTFNVVTRLTKTIHKTVKAIFQKTKAHFLLLTPPGMYALGFLIGYVWEKMKQSFPEVTFTAEGFFKLFQEFWENTKEFFGWIKEQYDEFCRTHPKTMRFLTSAANNIKEFLDILREDGLKAAINESTIGRGVQNTLNFLTDNWIFTTLKTATKVIIGLYKFIYNHPLLSGILYGTAKSFGILSKISSICRTIKIPLKGGLISGLVGLGAAYATEAVTKGVIHMFSESDMDKAQWNLNTKQDKVAEAMKESLSGFQQRKFGNLSDEKQEKYYAAVQFINDEYNNIKDYERSIKGISEILNNNKDDLQAVSEGNLYNVIPNLIDQIMNSQFIKGENRIYFGNAVYDLNIQDQITFLEKMLTDRLDGIYIIQQKINDSSSDDVLDDIISDDLQVKIISQKRSQDKIQNLIDYVNAQYERQDDEYKEYNSKWNFFAQYIGKLDDKKISHEEYSELRRMVLKDWGVTEYDNQDDFQQMNEALAQMDKKFNYGEHDEEKVAYDKIKNYRDVFMNLLGKDNAENIREQTIENMVKYASKDQLKALSQMLENASKDELKATNQITSEMKKLRDEIYKTQSEKLVKEVAKSNVEIGNLCKENQNKTEEVYEKIKYEIKNNITDENAKTELNNKLENSNLKYTFSENIINESIKISPVTNQAK